MTILSLEYSNVYYLKDGEKRSIKSNESLAEIFDCDMYSSMVKFLSLKEKIYIYSKEGDLFFSEKIKEFTYIRPSTSRLNFNEEMLTAYLGSGFVIAPFTLFRDVYLVPSFSLLNIENSILKIENYYPDYESKDFDGFKDINDFECSLKKNITKQLASMGQTDNILCTLSGGADSAVILKLLSDEFSSERITSVTCKMTGLLSEASKAKLISDYLKINNIPFSYEARNPNKFLSEYILENGTPVYDPICPVYSEMIKSLNFESKFRENNNYIIEGQNADSVLLGLPHNLLMQLYSSKFSYLFKLINFVLPKTKSKNTSLKRLFYRISKMVFSLSQKSWTECLLTSLDLTIDRNPYINYLSAQLAAFHKHYGSVHKAVAHFFLLRIIPVREMQKYETLPENYNVILPFSDIEFVQRAFLTKESFFIEKTKRKIPIFELVNKILPQSILIQKTTPFYVEYKLSESETCLNDKLYGKYKNIFDVNINSNDADRELKIHCLNNLYSFMEV